MEASALVNTLPLLTGCLTGDEPALTPPSRYITLYEQPGIAAL